MRAGKILPYLDVPFQHASPRILKAMKRPANSENNLARIRRWRETCPDLTIRSTFIVGFPGETDEEFEQLLEFIEDAQLDRVGCFTYSPVEGATANALANHVPDELKEERKARFMAAQALVSTARLKRKIGTMQRVLIDQSDAKAAIARSSADAPDIDGVVHVTPSSGLAVGEFVNVRITRSDEHDLWGVVV
jgi:ribosomal protein S12 methylthiotransferase